MDIPEVVLPVQNVPAVHRRAVVGYGDPGLVRDVPTVVPPGLVPAVLLGGFLNPPGLVGISSHHRELLGDQPPLAVPGGEQELVEGGLVELDGPGVGAGLRAGRAVHGGALEVVPGRVPLHAPRDVADELPAAAVHLGAILDLDLLLANVHVSPLVHGQDRRRMPVGVRPPAVQNLPAVPGSPVVLKGHPRVLPDPVSTIPPSLVLRPPDRRLLNPPLAVSVPAQNGPSSRDQPLLTVPGGEQELVELLAVERDGPGVGAGGGAHPAVPSCTAQLVPGRVPPAPSRHVPDLLPASAVNGGAILSRGLASRFIRSNQIGVSGKIAPDILLKHRNRGFTPVSDLDVTAGQHSRRVGHAQVHTPQCVPSIKRCCQTHTA
mmetsp:Transcript_51638/g.117462  ORF Transcript_51638/g.117462 Transcript_51638/m.117462 type:complete len:376 (+) Transcript_51638:1547-2674(+)